MSKVILSYNSLPCNIQNCTYNINNNLLYYIPVNQKIIEYNSPYFNLSNNINNSNILTKAKIDFYLSILNTIDKLILTSYIKDTQEIMIPATVNYNTDYSVTKTMDINIDLLMAYYVIKYSDDLYVDPVKLEQLRIELSNLCSQC